MPRPTTQAELLVAMDQGYLSLLEEIERCQPADLEIPGACEGWSVKDLLAHLDAWHELALGWEEAGRDGEKLQLPAPGLKWSETPTLNQQIYQRTKDDPWEEVTQRLEASHQRVRSFVAGYNADLLFKKGHLPWTGTTSVGAYAVSASSSHYDWAKKLIRKFWKQRAKAAAE